MATTAEDSFNVFRPNLDPVETQPTAAQEDSNMVMSASGAEESKQDTSASLAEESKR